LNDENTEVETTPVDGPKTAQTLALGLITISGVTLSLVILSPFSAVIAWSLALSVAIYPWYQRLLHAFKNASFAASVTLITSIAVIMGPFLWMAHLIISTILKGASLLIERANGDGLNLPKLPPQLNAADEWLDKTFHFREFILSTLQSIPKTLPHLLRSSAIGAIGLALVFFTTFFFLRDGTRLLEEFRRVLPLSSKELDTIFSRIADTLHATIYGILMVAVLQGFLGGLIFWLLNLPQPTIWGIVMGVLAVVPYLGAFIIWIPAAAILASSGNWKAAVTLVVWGAIVIGLSDNLLYPIMVGKRMRFHTLIIFLFLLGGLFTFGAAGVIIGPIMLALTHALLEVWHLRFQNTNEEAPADTHAPPARTVY
jgi:predicted PurR-regulated permease PerM